MKKLFAGILICLCFTFSLFAQMTEKEKADLAILNYVTYLSYDIQSQKNNRLYLEDIYNQIENNVLEDKIDEGTQTSLINMRNNIFKLRMIETQRNRIEFLYENKQTQAIKNAIPNPLYLLSVVQSKNLATMLMTLASTAVSSISNYTSAKNDANIEFLEKGWELDDKQMEELHKLSQSTWEYKGRYIRDNNVKAEDTLTTDMLREFSFENSKENLDSKIAFFEREESKKNYKYFGLYYLALVKAYYENGQYIECLTAIENFEKNNVKIFRKDYDYARVLPLVIVAAQKVYPKNYEKYIDKYLFSTKNGIDLTVKGNTKEIDWEIRYFVAQTCVQLYKKTNDVKYLEEAYSICFDAVRRYVDVQKEIATNYFKPIEIPETATKVDKEVLKQLQKARETELYPISEPLILNCELLYALFDELNKPQTEKDKIKNILSDAFVFPQLNSIYLTQTKNKSVPIDTLLLDLVKKTNSDIEKHSDDFKNSFINEYKSKYKDILLQKFCTKNEKEVSMLVDKARVTATTESSWTTNNTLVVPGNYLGQNSSINITINELNPNSNTPIVSKFENLSFKVDKIKKGKNLENLEEWKCYVSFLDEGIRNFSYNTKSSYSVIVDIKLGKSDISYVFFSKKSLIGIEFEQVTDRLLTSSVNSASFKFPKFNDEWNTKELSLTNEVENLLNDYILGSVKHIKDNSEDFRQSFINEYKSIYYEQIKEILGVSTELEVLNILEMDKNSSEIYASIEGTTVTLPANLIYSNSSISLELIEDDVKICSKNNIIYTKSNKVSEINNGENKEEVTQIELDFNELKNYKFDAKKNYKINMYINSGDKNYSILFVRKEYSHLILFKTQRFVTLSQHLKEVVEDQMEKNNNFL